MNLFSCKDTRNNHTRKDVVCRRLTLKLPKGNDSLNQLSHNKYKLYTELPSNFKRKEYDALAAALNIKGKTSEKYINDFIKNKLIEKVEHGSYKKIRISE